MVSKVEDRYRKEETLKKLDPEAWREWVQKEVEKELRRQGLPESGVPRMSFWKDSEGQLLWMEEWPEGEEGIGLTEVVRLGRMGAGTNRRSKWMPRVEEMMMTARGARPIFAALGEGMLEAGWNGGGGDLEDEREAAVREAIEELSRMPRAFREVISRSLEALDATALSEYRRWQKLWIIKEWMRGRTAWKMRTTPVTLRTDGSVCTSEVMMSFIPALRETSRRGRRMRITRRTLSARSWGMNSASSTRMEQTTMRKSIWFHADLMYAFLPEAKPSATILRTISKMNSQVITSELVSNALAYVSGMPS